MLEALSPGSHEPVKMPSILYVFAGNNFQDLLEEASILKFGLDDVTGMKDWPAS
jgi:hypothetical protein